MLEQTSRIVLGAPLCGEIESLDHVKKRAAGHSEITTNVRHLAVGPALGRLRNLESDYGSLTPLNTSVSDQERIATDEFDAVLVEFAIPALGRIGDQRGVRFFGEYQRCADLLSA